MPTSLVILGAGFGGLELATRMADELADEVEVTLIDKSDSFIFGFAKLDVMFGRRETLDDVRSYYRDIVKPNVTFRQETVRSIDPASRHVVTDGGEYDADILVVALGADVDPSLTPGLLEAGYEFYSPEGAAALRPVIESFDAGRVIIGVLGPFFKCPPAPFEAAFMLHDHFVTRGVRDAITLEVRSTLPAPIPISAETSQAIIDHLTRRGIAFYPQSRVTRLDPETKVAHIADGEQIPFDLFLGIPVHRAPKVVVDSGLTEDDGWIAVDPTTFATKFPDVFAVGDITSAPVPRAGVFAEGEAGTVADVLVARLKGGQAAAPYSGAARCYIEMGHDLVAAVNVMFPVGAGPTARFEDPSAEGAALKREFAATRRRRWFGATS